MSLLQAADDTQWRSTLFPEDWSVGYADKEGRFLHDFSYAGYHQGEQPIPKIDGPIFDAVKQFGADNTGKADASPQIQTAIDAAQAAGGGVVYIPEGNYLCQAGLKVNKSGIVIRGAGPGKTNIFFADETSEKLVDVQFSGAHMTNYEALLTQDVAQLSNKVYVEDAGDLKPGDDLDLGWVITDSFIEDHGMTGTWKPHNGKWIPFFQFNVVSVDTTQTPNEITLDTPLRYPAQVKNMASIKRKTHYIEECGIEDLSISNAMTKAAVAKHPQSVRRELIRFYFAKNCWAKNIESFAPTGTDYDPKYHVYDKGIVIIKSKRITVQDTLLQYAQRRDGGGHGYLYIVEGANDVLMENCTGIGGRHNFTASWVFGNVGNVYLRCKSAEGSLSDWNNAVGPSDFHHSLAIAMLIDSCTIDDGWEGMNRGKMSGGAGHTVTESVYWNCDGNGKVRSAQFGWGYLIGLADSLDILTEVDLNKTKPNWIEKQFAGTLPWDYVEGTGKGKTLAPQSLYEGQLKMRLHGADSPAPQAPRIESEDMPPAPVDITTPNESEPAEPKENPAQIFAIMAAVVVLYLIVRKASKAKNN